MSFASKRSFGLRTGLGVALALLPVSSAHAGGTHAQSYNNQATISVKGGNSTQLHWNANPDGWYLDAEAGADHSSAPGSAFAKATENFDPLGVGLVWTTAIGEGSFAGVDFASAEWLSDGADLLVGKPGQFGVNEGVWASAGSVPSATASAYGAVEFHNSFTLSPDGPGRVGASALIDVTGQANLTCFSLPGESSSASYTFLLELFDLTQGPNAPALYTVSMSGAVAGGDGPIAGSLDSSSGPIALSFNTPYLIKARLAAFASVSTPEPGSILLLTFGALVMLRRRGT